MNPLRTPESRFGTLPGYQFAPHYLEVALHPSVIQVGWRCFSHWGSPGYQMLNVDATSSAADIMGMWRAVEDSPGVSDVGRRGSNPRPTDYQTDEYGRPPFLPVITCAALCLAASKLWSHPSNSGGESRSLSMNKR